MTRPEKRLVKLQILVTDTELANLDDWRFENRAENRSSAVRELMAIGLELSGSHADEIRDFLNELRKR